MRAIFTIGTNGALYIVDWDELIMAPKERDLMYIGGGLMSSGLTPQGEGSASLSSLWSHTDQLQRAGLLSL